MYRARLALFAELQVAVIRQDIFHFRQYYVLWNEFNQEFMVNYYKALH
jgi:hypothetical protein